jgi:hypothetical protein
MDTYKCYYCVFASATYKDILEHMCGLHPRLCLKYIELELDSISGKCGYRTRFYDDICPDDCDITITDDNRIAVHRPDRSKRTTINTPKRSVFEHVDDRNLSDKMHDIDIESDDDSSDDEKSESTDAISYLLKCLPSVLEKKTKNMAKRNISRSCVVW